ncbi:signal transduction histidine kinase [Agromyces hippuratus]|uniref:histidine kinase n=1 Tax=Agromyces hippuratus TaxID=286438 RepID=A0A852WNS8_9MICO|nr:sensor histidine kinase [Agromyces hippuratus]NYG19407.1 signal transduction histidine kinase [Agromyces hippuratus]
MPVPQWDGRPERFRPPPGFVLFAPVVISLLVQVPAAIGIAVWTQVGWAAGLGQVALAAAGPLALIGARRYPGPTVAVVSAAALADLVLAPDLGPPYIAVGFAIVLAVARGAVVWAVASVVVAWVAAIVLASVVGTTWHPFRIAFTTLALAVCFGIGWFVRVRRARASAFRAEAMRRRQSAEERERVRIARELHDVIGHALSQINVQASVGLHLMDRDPEQARTALGSIKETSKSALDEVRTVLGVIRDGDAPLVPQAELAELPRLVRGVRSTELDARLDDRLSEPPRRAVQFAAYRIAQEALTNVVRHAGATHAVVTVERAGDEFVLTIDDDGAGQVVVAGAGDVDAADHGEGSGILGMRERAALLGGSVELGASPLGGTRVTARLPWGGVA